MKYSKFNLIVNVDSKRDIIFNTLSGETFLVSKQMSQMIENKDLASLSEEDKKMFYNKKLIIDDDVDENKIYAYYRNKAIYQKSNLSYTVLLTWTCNLRCVYCYEGAGEIKKHSMTKETANNLIKHIKKEIINRNSKEITILLFGGEPLINFKQGKYILEQLKAFCDENKVVLNTAIITNGVLFNEEIINDLINYNCKYIQITLDGTKDIHDVRRIRKNGTGTFDEIIEKLHLLNKYKEKLHVVIRINVDKINYKRVPELLEFLKKEKLDGFSIDFGIVRGVTEASNEYENNCISDERLGEIMSELWSSNKEMESNIKSYPMRKWVYCGLDCDNNYTIEPTGEVYKCWEHVGNKEYYMGEINEDGNIVNINSQFYKWMTQSPLDNEVCSECKYLPACGGGCRSVGFEEGKFFEGQCFKVKGVLEEEIKNLFINKLNKTN